MIFVSYLLPMQGKLSRLPHWVDSENVTLTGRYKIKTIDQKQTMFVEVEYEAFVWKQDDIKFLWMTILGGDYVWQKTTSWIHEDNIMFVQEEIYECSTSN